MTLPRQAPSLTQTMTAPAVPAKKTSTQTPRTRTVNGGQLRVGNPGNRGGGRPKDEVREKLLKLGTGKGLPFLADLLDGKVRVDLIGVCASCKAETTMDASWLEESAAILKASTDQRLRAVEQAWRYGLGTQKDVEVSVSSIRERVRETIETIQRLAPPEMAEKLIAALQPVWS